MNDAVVTLDDVDILTDTYITIQVLLALLVKRAPCAEVAPAEVGRTNEDFLSLLHDGIVYGDVFAFWETFVDDLLFLVCSVNGKH